MKVMIVVTHLLGTGHLARALTLARAYMAAGDKVLVVSGGMPAPLLTRGDTPLAQLPPLRSDGVDFSRLLDAEGGAVEVGYLATRQEVLLTHLRSFAPDVLITELFPFGRRILRDAVHRFVGGRTQAAPPTAHLRFYPRYSGPPVQTEKSCLCR